MRRILGTLGMGLIAAGLGAADVHACPAAANMRTVFHEAVPSEVTASVIARVTVRARIKAPSGISRPGPRDHPYSYVGIVRVDRVIKGIVEEPHIKLVAPGSDCDHDFDLGTAGIVIGETQRDERGMLELLATVSRPVFAPN
jgi:hypothetical protein